MDVRPPILIPIWRKLKQRLKEEGNQTVTNCHQLKMTAADGKQRLTDVADSEQLLQIVIHDIRELDAEIVDYNSPSQTDELPEANSFIQTNDLENCTQIAQKWQNVAVSKFVNQGITIGQDLSCWIDDFFKLPNEIPSNCRIKNLQTACFF